MLAFQLTVLAIIGSPCIAIGAVSLLAGGLTGWIVNRTQNRVPISITKASAEDANTFVPVMVLIPAIAVDEIDAAAPQHPVNAHRRHWIVAAINEKLARDRDTPKKPDIPRAA
jgi:hypothetical protein